MEDNITKINEYLVPANVSAKFEFFPGFGFKELGIVSIALVISIIIYGLLGIPKTTKYIDPANLESSIALTEDLEVNEKGLIEKKVPIISSIIRVFIGIAITSFSYFMVKRDPSSNMSIFYTLKSMKDYNSKQKLYIYKYNSGGEI